MRSFSLLFLLLGFFAACSGHKNNDGGLELTQEQLKALMKKQPAMGPEQGDAALRQLETSYYEDSSNLENVYNLAFMYCGQCLNDSSKQVCPKALQYLNRVTVLQANYRDGKAFYNLALCQQAMGQYEAGLENLKKFAGIHPDAKKAPVNYFILKAELLKKLNLASEACEALKAAAKVDTLGLGNIHWRGDCK